MALPIEIDLVEVVLLTPRWYRASEPYFGGLQRDTSTMLKVHEVDVCRDLMA